MVLSKYSQKIFYSFLIISFFHLLTSPLRPLLFLGIDRIYLAAYLIPSLIILMLFIKYKLYLKMTSLEFFMIFIPFLLILISILEHKSQSHLIMDILKPLLFISTIVFFKNVDIFTLCKSRYLNTLMYMNLFAGIFAITFLVYLYTTVGGFYLSAINIIFLLPVFYFLSKREKMINFISIVSILYSGKRGVLLAYLFSFFTYVIAQAKNKKIFYTYIFIFIFIILSVIVLFQLGRLDNMLIVKKMMSGVDAAGDQGILFALGGRAEEVVAALKVFYQNPILLLTGAGPGYTYDMKSLFGLELFDVHGVHFSPVGIFTLYGPIFFIVIYIYFLINLRRAYRILKFYRGDCYLINTSALFFIANFINSFTAFAIFTPVYYAISIGLINNIHIKGIR